MISLRNGGSVPRDDVPRTPIEDLSAVVVDRVEAGARVAAMFWADGDIWFVLADPADGHLLVGRSPVAGSYPSLTPELDAVHLFEREIWEQTGIIPEGHPWLKPVRFVRDGVPQGTVGVMDFYRVEGDEIHEVAVGPVHAGVIEPGHFRFQCHGEEVLHLEISLGYQHRGVERALPGGPTKRTIHLVETLAGDTTVGHTTAYCQVLEGLSGTRVPARALALRGVALELERLANHTGDLGALSGDVGYLPTASYCGRLRGDWLNLTAEICGNRFGRSLVVPGGVGFPVDADRAWRMATRAKLAMTDLTPSMQLLWDSSTVMARFEDTGRLAARMATDIGLVGLAARASGLPRDVRVEFPSGIFQYEQIPISTWDSGDVYARAWVRSVEIERSAAFVMQRLAQLPDGPHREALRPLAPDRVSVALVEGWRGEICHVGLTGPDSRLTAYKVVDPSFHNWTGLAIALRGQQISDFPLCNKSFNLSYCGHDL